jgi:hypothetical protein
MGTKMNEYLHYIDFIYSIDPVYVAIGLGGYVLYALVLWYTTWVFYCASICYLWAGTQIKNETVKYAALTSKIAWYLNVLLNWTVMSVIFLEFPREPNVSARCLRHYRHGRGWRQKLAGYIGRVWLDPVDPTGQHI